MFELLVVHFCCSWFMLGLIWIIQLVHYPTFHWIDRIKFVEFSTFHQKAITLIALPVMLIEILSSLILLSQTHSFDIFLLFLLTALTWILTLLISMPLHKKLNSGYQQLIVYKLIYSNWFRTSLWTFKSIWIALIISRMGP